MNMNELGKDRLNVNLLLAPTHDSNTIHILALVPEKPGKHDSNANAFAVVEYINNKSNGMASIYHKFQKYQQERLHILDHTRTPVVNTTTQDETPKDSQ